MMKPRVMFLVMLIIALLAFFTASYSSGDDHPEGISADPTTGAPSPHPKPKPTGTLSDLRVEHIWLDDQCMINFKLKNAGESTMPDRVHNQGMVRVYFGEEYEDFYFRKTSSKKKRAVDPRKALKSPGSTLPYNTKIELKEQLSVSAYVGYRNRITAADKQKGKTLTLLPLCSTDVELVEHQPALVVCGGKFATIVGDNGDNVINGTFGDDVIHGLGGNDIIDGKGGCDIICGGPGNDTIYGGPNENPRTPDGDPSPTTFVDCEGPWTGDHERLYGGPGNDTLDGGPGQECVFGEAGNDTLIGVEKVDTLIGGGGNDTYRFAKRSSVVRVKVIEAPNADTDTLDFSQFPTQTGIFVALNCTEEYTVSSQFVYVLSSESGIENLIGTPYRDTLRGNSRDNLIMGGDGGDSNALGSCGNQSERLEGREGKDTLMGQGGSDDLDGGEGDDILDGGPGIDCLHGGPGDDTMTGSQGNDWLWGGDDQDHLQGGQGDDKLWGNTGEDQLIGDEGDDILRGGPGQDQLTGGQGDDLMEGGSGDDLYLFAGSNLGTDTVYEEPNVDTDTLDFSQFTEGTVCLDLRGSSWSCEEYSTKVWFYNSTGVENVIGSDFDDRITGNSRDNVFDGGAGNDKLYGNEGNDTLNGNNDNDELWGGLGDDQLFGNSGDDGLFGGPGLVWPYPVTWTNGVNVQISGPQLTKTSGGYDWNAGAVSVETLAAGDGYVATRVAEANTHRMIGLSNGNSGVYYTDIDFAAFLHSDGTLRVYENGSQIASGPSYQSGDVIKIEVSGGTVYYKKNENTFYTSSNSPNYPLLVDTSIHHLNATLQTVTISGSFLSSGNDTCDGGADQDTAGPSCETKISIELNNPYW